MPIPRMLNQNFFSVWSPEMAYVLGFFAADGSMHAHNNGGHYIDFTNTDRILIERVRDAVHSNHLIAARERGGNCKTVYRMQIGSKTWFTDLTNLGFTQGKSRVLAFPRVPRDCLGDFIRGYFDGDGCIYFKKLKFADRKNKRWILNTVFTSGSKDFLKALHASLRENGVRGGCIRTKARGFDLSLSHQDSLALYKLIYHTAPATDLYLPRKYELFHTAITTLYPHAAVV